MLILIILLCLAVVFILMGIYCNKNLKADVYNLKFSNLPKSFEGFRIAQISDLHNCTHGKGNEKIIALLQNARPDIIVITGDMIDSRRTKIPIAVSLAKEIVKIAPCYYVCGNHEARMPKNYKTLLKELTAAGVKTLQNDKVTLKKEGDTITLAGAEDPYIIRKITDKPNSEIMDEALEKLMQNNNEFTILLSHRPELFSVYKKHHIDLCLTGHTHGGQIRLPLLGGLYAPNQGFLPKLCSGIYKEEDTTLFISRGVGSSQVPIRCLNAPQTPIIELHK